MKRFFITFYFSLLFVILTLAQKQTISIEAIWDGTFKPERLDALTSMKNGKQYAVLNIDTTTKATSIDIYNYSTSKKTETILNSTSFSNLPAFEDFTFSKKEDKIILATQLEAIYRRSQRGIYYLYDRNSKKVVKVAEEKIQEPSFSPDGLKIAYAYNNNLFVKNLETNQTQQITFDGEKNKIINGICDWVYEEEFAFVKAYQWNSASNQIAFIRFNETEVPEFSMDIYGTSLYPKQEVFKYPKAGEKNAIVSLHVYNLDTKKTNTLTVAKNYSNFYIPRIKWANNPNLLSAQFLNRNQNELDLWRINTQNNQAKLILSEKDEAYVDITDNLTFLKDDSFIWTSERDGFNHIYHYNPDGKLQQQVTKGNWEVTHYYGYNSKTNTIYYQSVENGSINRDIYSIQLDGTQKQRLTKTNGTSSADFSADFSYFINTFSSATTPPEYTLNDSKSGNVIRSIKDNDALSKKLTHYTTSKKEFSTLTINGNDLNMWMLKPAHFNANKKYPLFMYQYSGPGSQSVANRWNGSNDYWFQHLAQKGYIVVCVDGRGTGFKGAKFKKITQLQLGKYELEDQIAVAKKLAQLPYIDAERIGIFGWSFGGFMSSNAIFKANNVFTTAIAVAPVSSWRFYDTIYTERFMHTPQENPSGYDDNSPINFADQLQGNFLLVHGSADDNVHFQNAMQLAEALIQANKDFDFMVYPDKNHGIRGGNTRLHLYKKMTRFLDENLGDKLPDNATIKENKNTSNIKG